MSRKTVSNVILVLLATNMLALAPTIKPANAEGVDWWPMFHHDPTHTGCSTSTAPTTNRTLWKYTTGSSVGSSPVVVDGVVYVGSDDGNVYALNAATSAYIWNYTTGSDVVSSPAIVGGVVYVGSLDHNVYALNAPTGTHIWSYTTGDLVESSPAVVGGVVYIGSDDGNVYALNAATGAYIWNYTTGSDVVSSPAVVGGVVYVGSLDHNVYALNAVTGARLWRYTTGNPVESSPAVVGGVVYVGSLDHNVYALNATTGALLWSYTTGGWVEWSSPVVVGGVVYVGSDDGNVYALNAATGAYIWNYTTGSNVVSSPAIAANIVYAGSFDQKVYAINAVTGAYVWSYTTGELVMSSPAIAGGVVYVGSYDGEVYAFGPFPSSTSVVCSPNPVYAGSPVTCTATVSGSNPTGTVTWSTSSSTGNFSQHVCVLSNGTCSTIYVDSLPGSLTIAAYYSGDSNNGPGCGSFILTVTSPGPVYYSKNYISVQATINAAPLGATVVIAPGFYKESLIVNKTLTIIGERDQPGFSSGGSGIFLTLQSGASGTIVTGIAITDFDMGILIQDASNCRIYDNIMSSMTSSGIMLQGSQATGNVIFDNMFQDTPTPINPTGSATGNAIYDNIISSQSTLTFNVGSNGNSIHGNTMSATQIIVNMTNALNNVVYNNNFVATAQITVLTSGGNSWNASYPAGGNYWSDYQTKYPGAAEIDHSGIWNTAYVIDSNNKDNYPLMKPWTPTAGHNVAVLSVVAVKTVIGKGYSGNFTIAVANVGEYSESFGVTAYANTTGIYTPQVDNLGSANQATLMFRWDTTSFVYGNYTMSVWAWPVPSETDIANNNFILGVIKVTIPGDINGDFRANLSDLGKLAKTFNSHGPDIHYKGEAASPNWNTNADINNDGTVSLSDLGILAKHYNQHYP